MFDLLNQRNIYDKLNQLLASGNCTLPEFVHAPQVTKAILTHQGGIISYVEQNFNELVVAALNTDQKLTPEEQHLYDLVLRTYAERTAAQTMKNKEFINHILSLASDVNTPRTTLLCIAEIFASIFKNQSDQTIYSLTEYENFFESLLPNIDYTPIFDILRSLSAISSRAMTYYLDKINMPQTLFDKLVETQNYRIGIILANVCSAANHKSHSIINFCNEKTLDKILTMAVESEDVTFSCSCLKVLFSLLLQIEFVDASFDDDDEPQQNPLVALEKFFIDNFERFIKFVMDDREFTANKGLASQIIVRLIPFMEQPPEICDELIIKLFNMTIANPTKSMIHNALLSIFEALKLSDYKFDNFEKTCDAKITIAKLFRQRHFSLANYWAQLHRIADALNSNDESDKTLESTETDVSGEGSNYSDSDNDNSSINDPYPTRVTGIPQEQENVYSESSSDSDDEDKKNDKVEEVKEIHLSGSDDEKKSDEEKPETNEKEDKDEEEEDEDSDSSSDSTEAISFIKPPPIPVIPLTIDVTPAPKKDSSDEEEEEERPRQRSPRSPVGKTINLPPPPNKPFVFGPPPPVPVIPTGPIYESKKLPPRPTSPPPPTEEELADPWGTFIRGQFKQMSDIMIEDYGGKVPGGDSDLFFDLGTSDDDDF